MAGANPMQAQNMLNSTGRASLLRRRGLDKVSQHLQVLDYLLYYLALNVTLFLSGMEESQQYSDVESRASHGTAVGLQTPPTIS